MKRLAAWGVLIAIFGGLVAAFVITRGPLQASIIWGSALVMTGAIVWAIKALTE